MSGGVGVDRTVHIYTDRGPITILLVVAKGATGTFGLVLLAQAFWRGEVQEFAPQVEMARAARVWLGRGRTRTQNDRFLVASRVVPKNARRFVQFPQAERLDLRDLEPRFHANRGFVG